MTPYFEDGNIRLFNCEVMEGLRWMADESVQCCVTSPPYWGLRDYGIEGQIGLEKTPEEYIETLVRVFREVHRVLKKDGTLWLNIGDSYANPSKKGGGDPTIGKRNLGVGSYPHIPKPENLKPKDLVGIPWMLAFALRTDGWYLRQDIIWSKPNPMPESVTDRCTKSHEYIFLLSKSKKYFYDADAIREPAKGINRETFRGDCSPYLNQKGPQKNHYKTPDGWDTSKGNGGHGSIHRMGREKGKPAKPRGTLTPNQGFNDNWDQMTMAEQQANGANKRSVWNIATCGYPDAHFATFPPKLVEPCILAGSREGDTVLDTFFGSGVTGQVARDHFRKCDGIEISSEYCDLSMKRFQQKILDFL